MSNGFGGICFTPVKSIPEAVCCPSSARAMPRSGRLRGTPVTELLQEMYKDNPLFKAMGIAMLNALSESAWQTLPPVEYEVQRNVDALDIVAISDEAYVVVVGALAPFLKKLRQRGKPFTVLEMDASTLKPEEMPFYVPANRALEIIPNADVLVITGTTLINDTLDGLLHAARSGAHIAVWSTHGQPVAGCFFPTGGGDHWRNFGGQARRVVRSFGRSRLRLPLFW